MNGSHLLSWANRGLGYSGTHECCRVTWSLWKIERESNATLVEILISAIRLESRESSASYENFFPSRGSFQHFTVIIAASCAEPGLFSPSFHLARNITTKEFSNG